MHHEIGKYLVLGSSLSLCFGMKDNLKVQESQRIKIIRFNDRTEPILKRVYYLDSLSGYIVHTCHSNMFCGHWKQQPFLFFMETGSSNPS